MYGFMFFGMMAKKLLPILMVATIVIAMLTIGYPAVSLYQGEYPDYGCPAEPNGEFVGFGTWLLTLSGENLPYEKRRAVSYNGMYVDALLKTKSSWYRKNARRYFIYLYYDVHIDTEWDSLYISGEIGADIKGPHQYVHLRVHIYQYDPSWDPDYPWKPVADTTSLVLIDEGETGYIHRQFTFVIGPNDWRGYMTMPLPPGDYRIEVELILHSQTQTVLPTWHWVDAYGTEYGSEDGRYVLFNVIKIYDG